MSADLHQLASCITLCRSLAVVIRMQPSESDNETLEPGLGHARTVRQKYMFSLGYRSLKLGGSNDDGAMRRLPRYDPRLTPHRPKSHSSSRLQSPLLQPVADVGDQQQQHPARKKFLSPGSMLSSVFTLASSALGAGVLSLPYAFRLSGFGLGLVLLAIAAVTTIYSISLLVSCRDETRLSSFEDMAVLCFGKRVSTIIDVTIITFCFGCSVAYIVASHDIVAPILIHLFPDNQIINQKAVIMSAIVCLVMFPLSLVDKISSLRFSSLIGIASICYLVMAVVFESVLGLARYGTPPLLKFGFRPGWSTFRALSIFMFAFTCQINIFSIYTELQRPSIRRMKKVARRSTSIIGLLYALIGVFGFLQHLDQTAPDILYNYDLVTNPMMGVAQVAMAISLALAFPYNVFPLRFTLELALFPDSEPSQIRFHALTFSITMSALAVAIFAPSIDRVFSLLGSTTSAFVSFILPGLFYLFIFPGPLYTRDKFPALMLVIVGSILAIVGTVIEFVDML